MRCRHCQTQLHHTFIDLGYAPPSNAYLAAADLRRPELTFPLRVLVCHACWLVQTEDYAEADMLFAGDYAYFSSTSRSWLAHAAAYCAMITRRLKLNRQSLVVELASNDGYLLKNFVAAGIPCLGVEPTAGTADAAEKFGIPVVREFFSLQLANRLAADGKQADLICGNNVYAHVPDINDFTAGMCRLLKPEGTVTLEFPHLLRLIENNQFDTIYHEHFSYLSLLAVQRIFTQNGLRVYAVEELPTHGGSLRVYGCHFAAPQKEEPTVAALLARETSFGLNTVACYEKFQGTADKAKDEFLSFLIREKNAGKTVAAYGAAAKGNTLLNYAGIRPDLIRFVCDAAASKQNKFLPGSHLPILAPAALQEFRPDWIVIFPWNIAEEITEQLAYAKSWGSRFVVAVPELRILP